ncbi:MAG: cell division protein FtsX [Hyphomicrobium sp.]
MSGSFNKPLSGHTKLKTEDISAEKKISSSTTFSENQNSTIRTSRGPDSYPTELTHSHYHNPNTAILRPSSSRAQQRVKNRNNVYKNAPIVPAGSVTSKSLTLVISIMCFLACLTAVAVYMVNQSANAWLKDLSSEITVQIEQRGNETDNILSEATDYLKGVKGIKLARPLSIEETTKLLEPWIGKSDSLNTLPIPRLIAIELDRKQSIDIEGMRKDLSQKFEGVYLDDHRQWQLQIRTLTRSLALGGITILLLMTAATTAIIVSATRSSMASNREIIEVLHFVGATDRFIAREFEKHFLRLGIRAGCVGALLAIIAFTSIPVIMQTIGEGTSISAEMHRLFGSSALDTASLLLLGIVVVIVSSLCVLTSRIGVFRILNSRR